MIRSSRTAAVTPRSVASGARLAEEPFGATDTCSAASSSRACKRACSVVTCARSCSASRAASREADVLPVTPARPQPTTNATITPSGQSRRPMVGMIPCAPPKGDFLMTTRRAFLGTGAALAGLVFVGCDLLAARPARAQGRRRTTTIAGKQVKVIDVHAHCGVGEAMALMGLKLGDPTPGTRPELNMITHVSGRLQAMDEQGIDMEALSINPYWYKAERDLAKQVCQIQNEKLAAACAANPDRFVAFATVALQHPDLAVEQLEDGMKKHGLRGAGIGGSVNGDELSHPRLDPFWAKAEQLGAVIFIHPQGTGVASEIPKRFKGNGLLGNIIGNPLETTIALTHLIFDGTLDKYPGLKII